MAKLQDKAISLDYLVGIAGTQGDQSRHRPQGYQVLDGLVGRTILAVAHSVMREHEKARQFHERCQANCRTRVIAEYEERRAKRPQLGQSESVDDCGHGVLANAEVQVLSARI